MALRLTSVKGNPELIKLVGKKYKEQNIKLFEVVERLMMAYIEDFIIVSNDEYEYETIENPKQHTISINMDLFKKFRDKCDSEGRGYAWVLQILLKRDYQLGVSRFNKYTMNGIYIGDVSRD